MAAAEKGRFATASTVDVRGGAVGRCTGVARVLGVRFGLTYLATDTNLKQRVAVKECAADGVRDAQGPDGTVIARSEEMEERYRWGLERFVSEAQVLARFDHPNIVRG